MKFTILAYHSLIITTIRWSDLCPEVVKEILKNECISTIWLISPRPSTKSPALGVMELIIFVDPSVVAQFFLSMPRGREEDSKEIDEFYTFCTNITCISPLDGSYEMLYTNFGKNQPSTCSS